MIKRTLWSLLSTVLLLGILIGPMQARAAAANSQAGTVSVTSGRLNVRSSGPTAASVVASLSKGSYVTLISRSGAWWKVEYTKGQYGYCHADYIIPVSGSPATVKTQSGSLNVRSGPGTSHSRVGSLAKGETVIVLSASGGWSKVLYHGTKTGYVTSDYLSGQYPAVSLWVPDLKQTDSRWADQIVGGSGQTFAQIGCATTAVAMVESHRTGKTIYPDEIAKQLRYTPSGSLYWPSHYTAVTDGTNLLSGIYTRLKQGKPVLFGARNAAGSQHWVVVTGFAGGSSLTASGFTIRDPGTHSRTNLQQFLNVFPNFYKYFFY